MTRPLRTLLFSTLYPSGVRPLHGIFVETRLRELLCTGAIETKVVAPVPWFPFRGDRWGEYGKLARTPLREVRNGIDLYHPRYPLLPKVGMSTAPWLMAAAVMPTVRRIIDTGFDFDVLDAHYYYPDGVAAALMARQLRKPLVITARGTDLNLIPQYALPRRMMQWAARHADASVGVSAALTDVLRGWGIAGQRLRVIRNGVDLQRFRPMPQAAVRRQLGVVGQPVLLSVGNLVESKGHHLAVAAMPDLRRKDPDVHLLIVGSGADRGRLEAQIRALDVGDAVTLVGAVPNESLAEWYSAADALILASSREGLPNVVLEAMACGTPIVATRVGGIPEVVCDERVGVLLVQRDVQALVDGIQRLFTSRPERAHIRRHAENFSWVKTSEDQLNLFSHLLSVTK